MLNQELKKIIQEADEWARDEFTTYSVPIWAYDTANQAGQKLATHFEVDKGVIMLGTILMDIALGRALKQNKIKEHVQMSYDEGRSFLGKYDIDSEIKTKILNGVKYHHGTDKFPSLEAEIIMNADCYKFLIPENIKKYYKMLREERQTGGKEAIEGVRYKYEEKKNSLSLDYCKKELEPNFKSIEDFLLGKEKNDQ